MSRTVAFATLGCRLNQVDTQQLQGLLEARGFRTVGSAEPADVVVVNTCTVTARAELSDRQAIRRAARVSPHARLVVTGCWAQTSPGAVGRVSRPAAQRTPTKGSRARSRFPSRSAKSSRGRR